MKKSTEAVKAPARKRPQPMKPAWPLLSREKATAERQMPKDMGRVNQTGKRSCW